MAVNYHISVYIGHLYRQMLKRIGRLIVIAISIGLMAATSCFAQTSSFDVALEKGFQNPPESALPRTWWHWTNGNVTKEGITKDLEWMKRIGIGGFQLDDVAAGSGQVVEKKLLFGTPEWLDAVHHSAAEADRLGLEMAIFSSPGWSETGGPWVKPEQAMKKLVWSEITIEGPRRFDEKLPSPPSNNGPIRNLATGGGGRDGQPPSRTYYADCAVLAYPTPTDEANMSDLHPQITSSAATINGAALIDDDLNTAVTIPSTSDGAAWVQYEFEQPFRARAVTIASRSGIPVGRITASDDGDHFHTIVELPGAQQYRGGLERTFAFPETTAKFYRLEMTAAPLNPAATMGQQRPQPAQRYILAELIFHSGARLHRWEEKAGFSFLYQYESVPTPPVPASASILDSQVMDLTSKMAADGTLQWEVPGGRWTIQRFGYSLTGAKNRPAVATGSGYEVDKLSRKHVEAYYHGYFDPLAAVLGPLFGKSLRYVTMDSWEAGMQNWTDEMLTEFQQRRGYNPTPYLPALSGRVIDSGDVSDRFLWDFRRTLADMFADNHYGTMARLLHGHGIGIYAEAAGVSMEVIEDTLLNKSQVDIPMGEFWVRALHPELQYCVDVRGAASAAHAYGKPLVATESFTGGGYEAPFTLKKISDYWFAQGVNRLVFHTSAEQPLDSKPGNTMVGTHINRNITWAELAAPFMIYLSRSSFMLQQGLFVADVAYLLPEGAPSSQPFWGSGLHPACPDGYNYDCINTDVLLNRISVSDDGRLVLPDGMSYRVLVLPEINCMTPKVLRKIHQLVAGGATVVGQKPVKSPSLEGYPQADAEVQALASELWGDLDGISRNRHFYGKGQVVWRLQLADVLASLPVPKDFECSRPLDADVVWIHRSADNADIYFVANRTDCSQDLQTRYRVRGKEAEIWHPDTGTIEPASYSTAEGRTTVPLHLAERESVFVVFRQPTSATSRTLPEAKTTELATLNGPWQVHFPPALGVPDKIKLSKLESWTTNADPGVKYFSGTATYSTSAQAPQSWFGTGSKLWLDLGSVKDLAEVSLNGRALGILWKPPYRIDVSSELHPGENRLEIQVTNQWTNRIIGDRLVPPDQKVLTTSGATVGPGGARPGFGGGPQVPSESGLLGPVTVISQGDR